jgi:hypothetical protein
MSLSTNGRSLPRVSISSMLLGAMLLSASARQVAAADDEGAKRSQPSTAISGGATPGASRTISGRVVDPQGKPVEGARVWWVVQRDAGFTAAGRADRDGQFRLTTPTNWVPNDAMQRADVVWALGPNNDLAVACLEERPASSAKSGACLLRLNPAEDRTIDIVDPDEQPVAGALIEPMNFRGGQGIDLIPDPIRMALRGTTNPTGHVRMHIGFRDFFNLRVTSDRFGIQTVQLNPRNRSPEHTIHLKEVGRLEGRLIANDAGDVKGVRLNISSASDNRIGSAAVISDEQGKFVVPEIASGQIQVYAHLSDGTSRVQPRLPKSFRLRAGETAELEIPVQRMVPVRGSVETEDTHAPVVGANVTVGFGNGSQGSRSVTDAKGRFEVYVLPGAVNAPAISALPKNLDDDYEQAGEPGDRKVNVPPGDKPFEMPPVVLVRRVTIQGKVIEHDGRPLANATVCGDVGNRRYGFCETGANGEFSMRVPRTISPQRYEVFAPKHDRNFDVTIVQERPLVLKAVDGSEFAKPIPPRQ